LYFSGTLNWVTGILDDLFFYECFNVSMGQWDLAVVVIKVGVLASGGEREGLLKSLEAQHGGIMERMQCYRQESNATRIGTETFDGTYAPEVLW
jgi:hypothetical protein